MNEKLKLLAGRELLPSSWPPWVHLNWLGHSVPHFIGQYHHQFKLSLYLGRMGVKNSKGEKSLKLHTG